jgi:hypothetical protein
MEMEHKMYQQDCQGDSHSGFRHLMPLLIIPIAIGVMRGMARHRFGQMAMHHEGWKGGVPPMFAEMHRRAHAAEAQSQAETTA